MPTASRTYWLTTPCRIRRKDQSLLIERVDGTPVHIPITDVRDIVCCDTADINTAVISLLNQHRISVHFLSHYGDYAGSLLTSETSTSGQTVLAQVRLADDPGDLDTIVEAADPGSDEEAHLPAAVDRQPLAARRRAAVLAVLESCGATRVLDLGCGGGALLAELVRNPRYTEIVGTDVSPRALALAERRLRLDRLPARQRDRIRLWQSALTYRDDRLRGFDAAVLMEVVEHVDPPRLPALEAAVFGHARPGTVVVTTPNVEYNVRYPGLAPGALRHADHRFEWSRRQFADWAARVGATYGYTVSTSGVGDEDPEVGAPTQLAVFTRTSRAPHPADAPPSATVAPPGTAATDQPGTRTPRELR